MCGGRGTRLDRGEKPLFEVAGEPMVDRVLGALTESRVETVHAVTSPHTPKTAAHLADRVPTIEGAGDGYVADLTAALEVVDPPVTTVVSDLPLLAGEVVDRTLDAHTGGSLTVCVPTALKRALGVSVDAICEPGGRPKGGLGTSERRGATLRGQSSGEAASRATREPRGLAPTGLNVVGGGSDTDAVAGEETHEETLRVSYDVRLAVNVNRPEDAAVAGALAGAPETRGAMEASGDES